MPGTPLYLLHRNAALGAAVDRLPRHFRVERVDDWPTLEVRMEEGGRSGVLIVDPYLEARPGGGLPLPLCRLRQAYPSSVVIAAVREGLQYAELRELAQVGVAEVIRLGFDDSAYRLERLVERARERAALHSVLRSLPAGVAPRTRALLEAALTVAVSGRGVAELARTLFVSVRTLQRRCARSGLPSGRSLLALLRMVLAARFLEDPGRTVLSAALAAGYSSDTSLHRAFRRVGLPSPASLRGTAALERATASFLEQAGMSRDRPANGG